MKKHLMIIAMAGLVCLAWGCKKENGKKIIADFSGGCEAVDMGLSVKWASYNVGAENEDDSGIYVAFGEAYEKAFYGWSKEGEYKWGVYDMEDPVKGMTKYNITSDLLSTLQSRDDAATVNWGSKWRMPTVDEVRELFDKEKCTCKWDAARKGCVVTSLITGNSIFLPASGYRSGEELVESYDYGVYWASSVCKGNVHYAYIIKLSRDYQGYDNLRRLSGCSVRAVTQY